MYQNLYLNQEAAYNLLNANEEQEKIELKDITDGVIHNVFGSVSKNMLMSGYMLQSHSIGRDDNGLVVSAMFIQIQNEERPAEEEPQAEQVELELPAGSA